jgi:hypothetical protein
VEWLEAPKRKTRHEVYQQEKSSARLAPRFRWVALTFCAFFALAVALLGCRKTPDSSEADESEPSWFVDTTDEVGVDFRHDAGPVDGRYFMPQIVGSGIALFDFDGDDRLDLYLMNCGGPTGRSNRLYRQLPNGTFEDVSRNSGLDISGYCMGAAVGDVNNDGLPDIAISQYGSVRLFLNNGNGTFTEITEEAGLDNPLWATSIAFVDYDRDGLLDLFVTNYVAFDREVRCPHPTAGGHDYCPPKTFNGTTSKLYRNLGVGGATKSGRPLVRFKDVSFASGIGRKAGPGLGVVCADFNGDGWPDVFVANDGAPNHLWINQKDGKTFKDEAAVRGVAVNAMAQVEANMGIGWGDLDGDGLQDLFVTHLGSETNTVWKQGPAGLFHDVTTTTGLDRPGWRGTGFGTVLGDFDNSGMLHAAVVNGAIWRRAPIPDHLLGPHFSQYAERNQLFRNDGKGRFRDVSELNKAFCGHTNVGRGLAMGDLRNDGSLWLVSSGLADRVQLFRPIANKGRWLLVQAIDPRYRRDALGAEVHVYAGGKHQVRTIHTSASYLCSNDPRAHFGLGSIDKIDRIEVRWPDGVFEEFPGGDVNRLVKVQYGSGKRIEGGKKP